MNVIADGKFTSIGDKNCFDNYNVNTYLYYKINKQYLVISLCNNDITKILFSQKTFNSQP